MSDIRIITNNVPRRLIYGYELTEKERQDFDYYSDDQLQYQEFFRYKGNVYDPHDCEYPGNVYDPHDCEHPLTEMTPLSEWDGYFSDSFFSGVVFKWHEDTDYVIVGRYYT